ncbi:hypothetical protein BD779DRAFT_222128 [Infundibulicybe gibba]|nr:hypothetical protein BD779DRAFT_222128 [Infundibulicybe gibba]
MAGVSPSPGSPAIPHSALAAEQQGQTILTWSIWAFCALCCEWLVSLPQEYRYVWKGPIGSASLFYLVNRYFGLLQFSFVVALISGTWAPDTSSAMCKLYREPFGALMSFVFSQHIFRMHRDVMYPQSLVIEGLLCATHLTQVGVWYFILATSASSLLLVGPPGTGPLCGVVVRPRGSLLTFYAMPLLYHSVTFLVASWRTYRFWKQEVTATLSGILRRYGVLYFFALFSTNVANMVIVLTASKPLEPADFMPMLILEVTLSCRLFLSLHSPRKSAIYFWCPPTSQEPRELRRRKPPIMARYRQDTLEPDAAPGNSKNRNSPSWPDSDKENPTKTQSVELSLSFVEDV